MLTDTTERPKHNTNHREWKKLTAIGAVASAVVLTGAVAPARSQPGVITNEITKLLAFDGALLDSFGRSAAISGSTIIIGSPQSINNGAGPGAGSGAGAAYIVVRDVIGAWTLQAKLIPLDGDILDLFGDSVAINGDTVIVGAIKDDDNGDNSGSAYIFVRDATGVWTQQAKLLASVGAAGDAFGSSVAISGDTAVVGANGDDDKGSNSGATYVFVRDAIGLWTQQAKLFALDQIPGGQYQSAGDQYGSSVAVSGDTIVVGAPSGGALNLGSAAVFVRDASSVWSQQVRFQPINFGQENVEFGASVAMSGDTALIGSPFDNGNDFGSGSAYVFVRDAAGLWTFQARLFPSDGTAGDVFSGSVAIDGDMAIIGAERDDDNGLDSGSAYVFVRDAVGAWTQQVKLLPTDGAANDQFGHAVVISGETTLASAFNDDDNGFNSGSAYIFTLGLPADLNGDGVVNASDLATILAQWGCMAPASCPADLNGDGAVDAADLAQLLASWS